MLNREKMIANWKNSLAGNTENPAGAVEIVDNLDAITGGFNTPESCTCSGCCCHVE